MEGGDGSCDRGRRAELQLMGNGAGGGWAESRGVGLGAAGRGPRGRVRDPGCGLEAPVGTGYRRRP